MADVIAAAVRRRQAVLDAPVSSTSTAPRCGSPRPTPPGSARRARSASRVHNEARPAAARAVIELVARKYADKLGENVLGGANLLDAAPTSPRCAGRSPPSPPCTALIDRLWPRLTAERLRARPVRLRRRARRGDPRLEPRPTATSSSGRPRHRGRRPTCRCSRRPTSCWASTTPPQRTAARREQQQRRRRRPGDARPAARLPVHRQRDRGGGRGAQRRRPARRRGPGRAPGGTPTSGRRPSAPPPTAPGPTGT